MESKPKPKVVFPIAWNLTDRKFVVEKINEGYDGGQIVRMAGAAGLKNITKSRVGSFLMNYQGALLLRTNMKSGRERSSISSKRKTGQPSTASNRRGLYRHLDSLKKGKKII